MVGLASCGQDCIIPPCALSTAVTVTVTSAATGQPVANAFLREPPTGERSNTYPCIQSSGVTTCNLFGTFGTHTFEVGAPGFQTVARTIDVSGSSRSPCGCDVVETQHIAVALAVAP